MIQRLAPIVFAAALTAPLSAELTLYFVEPDLKETPVGGRITAPEVTAGDFVDIRLRVRNTGTANESVSSFLVRGAGFFLREVPGLPFLLVPGMNMEARLRFQPTGAGTYSGTLLLNGSQVLVTGRSPDVASLWSQGSAGWQLVSNLEAVDFGRVQAHTVSTLLFAFRNTGSIPVTVRSAVLSPGAFELAQTLELPLTLAAGAELAFAVKFAPTRGGVFRATFDVDGRVVNFAGNAYEPALPEPLLSFDSPSFESGRQQALRIRFAGRAQGNGVMRLTLAFTPQQGSPDDPAIQFVANSSRTIAFNVHPGDESLRWNGDANIIFQTGTTAGTIRFSVSYDSSVRTLDYAIAPAPPKLETARLLRSQSTISLTLTGFDNTRSISTLAFTWYHRDGSVIGGGPLVSQVGTIFGTYFRNSAGGSGFLATASFPVSGSTENVVGLEIEAMNGAGSTRATRIAF